MLFGMAGGGGVIFAGGGPVAPGWLGPFTTCTPATKPSLLKLGSPGNSDGGNDNDKGNDPSRFFHLF